MKMKVLFLSAGLVVLVGLFQNCGGNKEASMHASGL